MQPARTSYRLVVCLLALLAVGLLPLRGGTTGPQGDLIVPLEKPAITNAPLPAKPVQDGDFVGFDQLAGFGVHLNPELLYTTNRVEWANQQINAMIPDRIKAADGKTITVDGFMIPLEYQGSQVSKFILAMNQNTCCFGASPQINEFIIVSLRDKCVDDEMDIPLRVKGVLHVAVHRERGTLSSIYRMDAQSVTVVPKE